MGLEDHIGKAYKVQNEVVVDDLLYSKITNQYIRVDYFLGHFLFD